MTDASLAAPSAAVGTGDGARPWAVVTGASSGIGVELARCAVGRRHQHRRHDRVAHVTCLMPGPTDTHFFERAGLLDTDVRQSSKAGPADVARIGCEARRQGDGNVVAGWKDKRQVALAAVTPSAVLAEQQRKMAEPGSVDR